MSDLGIVVIGRNEGERLVRCLASIGAGHPIVYVDSGSTDASVANARRAGATVVELDMRIPFTAARARNAGRAALGPDVAFVQCVDGDCVLKPGWLDAGRAALAGDPTLAVVFGRLREVAPQASVYNWLCDVEWSVPPGEARYFGGNAMLRTRALDAAGGYAEGMIAGEEPDLAIRLRGQGWRIACLPADMASHDAAMTRFGQWWRRAERSGHAYAELEDRHPGEYRRRIRAALLWGGAIPVSVAVLLLGAAIGQRGWPALLALAVMTLPLLQIARIAWREMRQRPARAALARAAFLLLDKPPHALGIARYWRARLSGRRTPLIEYKEHAA